MSNQTPEIIPNRSDLKINNLSALPGGTGAKYLLCLRAHNGDLVAHSWKRVMPKSVADDYVLVSF